ncbi:b0f7cbc6-711e-48b1-8f37-20c90317943c [Sclerotinia trifoliorum]|uniref:B0f7cbc6-711e-48b1-8f37-20c90317943c n=1 Tax=Sclerotinia trifoliorum TaxID=28548 RepID=A0A8H2ZQL5_9HELO|nr:b0f7cbc6-711e-48b1-8f37-20c90317943c [Sclerotinia trifoliorum]
MTFRYVNARESKDTRMKFLIIMGEISPASASSDGVEVEVDDVDEAFIPFEMAITKVIEREIGSHWRRLKKLSFSRKQGDQIFCRLGRKSGSKSTRTKKVALKRSETYSY